MSKAQKIARKHFAGEQRAINKSDQKWQELAQPDLDRRIAKLARLIEKA